MEAVEFMVTVSNNYPSIAWIIKALAVLIGTGGVIFVLVTIVRMEVFQSVPPGAMTYGGLLTITVFSGLLLAFGWTMQFVAQSAFETGGHVLEAFEGTQEWAVREGLSPRRALQEFALATCKVLGAMFGFWGLISGMTSTSPNAQHGLGAAAVRLVAGAIFFSPIEFLDLFGGFGTQLLVD